MSREHRGRRPCARPARARSPGRARSRPPSRRPRRGGSARRCARAPRAGRPGRGRRRRRVDAALVATSASTRSARPAARSAARCRSGCARRARTRVRVAARPAGAVRAASTSIAHAALARAQLELGGHRARQLAELDRLRAQRHLRRPGARGRAARSASTDEPAQLAPRVGHLLAGRRRGRPGRRRRSSSSSSIVPWSIVSGVRSSCEAVETNERRAASWRRSSSCIRAERAREVADLVAAVVARRGRVRALAGDPQRGARRRAEPARQRARERERRARSRRAARSPRREQSALRTWPTARR